MRCAARDFAHFLRIDDEDCEIAVKVVVGGKESMIDPSMPQEKVVKQKPLKADIVAAIDEMVKSWENLPPAAMVAPVTYYDLLSVLLLLSSVAKMDD